MHYNIRYNDLIKNDTGDQTFLNYSSSAITKSNTGADTKLCDVATLTFDASAKEHKNTEGQNEASDSEKCLSANTSCKSSTDSGVNVSDNEEILSFSPTFSHSYLFETNEALSNCCKELNATNKQLNDDNNFDIHRDNNCKITNNNNENKILNRDNDDDNNGIRSKNFDKKFKVVDTSSGGQSSQYKSKNQNPTKNKNAINIDKQHNLPTSPTSKMSDEKTSLQHNEFINLKQRHASTSSLLSASSIVISDDENVASNNYHCNGSPVVSIRSISSTIITSDSDTDSDVNSDIEGVHENYVIKKLGTQLTFPPKDPAIPKINSGHTVLNQKVIANSNQVPLPPLEALAAIGDRIGAAQALGPVPSTSAVAQRPQIGSIALSNSSDVTFGDKHFYEGPVTIQQFLIDGRDKWKEANGEDNPTFENVEGSTNNAKDINTSTEKSSKLYTNLLKRKKLIIPGVLGFAAVLILVSILGSQMLNESKNTNNNHAPDEEECEGNGTLCLIDRDVWHALPQGSDLDKQVLPLHRVVISHTASESCETIKICADRVRVIQEFHMYSLGWDDIGYNFLISNEGHVYVGRGWDIVGAHTKGYNYDSVGITFIGTYISIEPTEAQLNACLLLLEEGVRLKKLSTDYHLYGARQLGATESPGEMLYRQIKKWEHWSPNINLDSKKV